jgi:hypothetical protein
MAHLLGRLSDLLDETRREFLSDEDEARALDLPAAANAAHDRSIS